MKAVRGRTPSAGSGRSIPDWDSPEPVAAPERSPAELRAEQRGYQLAQLLTSATGPSGSHEGRSLFRKHRAGPAALRSPWPSALTASSHQDGAVRAKSLLRAVSTLRADVKRRWLPGFDHAVACPATGGLAEHPGELALGKRHARLDARAVGGHGSGVDVVFAVSRSVIRSGQRDPVGSCSVRVPARVARLVTFLVR